MYYKWRSVVRRGLQWNLLVIILAHLSATGAQEYPPEISEPPLSGSPQIEGTTKTLTCTAVSQPSPVYTWFRRGQIKSANLTTSSLRITNLSLDDAGEYRCLASNYLGAELSRAAIVIVMARIPFQTVPAQTLQVTQGKFVVLQLPPLNTRGLEFTINWEENSSTMPDESLNHYITLDRNLVFLSADMDLSSKVYRAVAEYIGSTISSTSAYSVNVRSINNPTVTFPEVVIYPKDTNVTIDIDLKIELECVINARPLTDLNILWYKNLKDGTNVSIEVTPGRYLFTPFKRRFVIRSFTESDSGFYFCKGVLRTISGGVLYENFTEAAGANVIVQVPPSITNVPIKTLDREISQSVQLPCQANGVPPPTLTWYFNGKELSTILSARHTVYSNGSLSIINVDLTDAGKYQCFARNSAGEIYIAFTLKVNSVPPNIVKAPQNLTVVEQSDARFLCEVTGAPTPVVVWKKVTEIGDVPVVIGGRFQINFQSNLLIVSVQKADAGVYKCFATNVKGVVSETAALIVITKMQIVNPPENQTTIFSMSAVFECGVVPHESIIPVWEWFFYKNGDLTKQLQLPSAGRYHVQNDGTLIVKNVSAEDIGLYKCHVISASGNDSRIASLNVIDIAGNLKLMINSATRSNVILNENETVTLTCHADARPVATVVLEKDGVVINSSQSPLVHRLGVARCKDSGRYKCSSSNIYGQSNNVSRLLFVKCSPRSDSTDLGQLNYQNKFIQIIFDVTAYPMPSIFFFAYTGTNGRDPPQIINSIDLSANCISIGLITAKCIITVANVTSPNVQGQYVVSVGNSAGQQNYTFYVLYNGPTLNLLAPNGEQNGATNAASVGGGIGGAVVVLIVVIVIVIFVLRKKNDNGSQTRVLHQDQSLPSEILLVNGNVLSLKEKLERVSSGLDTVEAKTKDEAPAYYDALMMSDVNLRSEYSSLHVLGAPVNGNGLSVKEKLETVSPGAATVEAKTNNEAPAYYDSLTMSEVNLHSEYSSLHVHGDSAYYNVKPP